MRDFLHRFYPYQAFKLMLQRVRPVLREGPSVPATTAKTMQQDSLGQQPFDPIQARTLLVQVFGALKQIDRGSSSSSSSNNGGDASFPEHISSLRTSVLQQQLGFNLEVGPSQIPNSGLGVFLRGGRIADPGTVVSMYPGTLYRPGEAILFNSISNRYILKCNDGVYVDGKANGLSGSIFRSVNGRDNYPGITPTADTTWMMDWSKAHVDNVVRFRTPAVGLNKEGTEELKIESISSRTGTGVIKNPLAVGQIINNGTTQFPPNVRYQELDIRTRDCPLELQEFLPNIWYSDDWHAHDHDHDQENPSGETQSDSSAVNWNERSQSDLDHLRTVVLITTKSIEEGEELYSTYIEQHG